MMSLGAQFLHMVQSAYRHMEVDWFISMLQSIRPAAKPATLMARDLLEW